nr:MAG TPA: hypothetical protein [Caudoviricetes sp.]
MYQYHYFPLQKNITINNYCDILPYFSSLFYP